MATPLFSFGVIADVQYADVEDGYNYARTRKRYYRNSLKGVSEAGKVWNIRESVIKFVLNLGDIIDGKSKHSTIGSQNCLDIVLREFSNLGKPVYHTWGNHEFYNFSREYLMKSPLYSINQPDVSALIDSAYYTIHPHPKLMIVNLDCYEISKLGYNKSGVQYQEAVELLTQKNTNTDKNDISGLAGDEQRFAEYNGGIGPNQLDWLAETLQKAVSAKTNVIIMGHIPLLEASAEWSVILWNYKELLSVFGQFKECILCYLAGHSHIAMSGLDEHGILHITYPGVVEAPPGSRAFGTMDVYNDRLDIQGEGTAESFCLPMKYPLPLS